MKNIISDSLWNEIENAIPKKTNKVGRPESPPRIVLEGIVFILQTGSQWKRLPKEYGAPSTIHGKFMIWARSGVFEEIMFLAKKFYESRNNKMPNWIATDTSSSKAPFANWSGKNPTDRGKRGIKKSIMVDFAGAPIGLSVGPANRHDSKFLYATIKDTNIKRKDSPTIIAADSAYDTKTLRQKCAKANLVLLASTNRRRDKKKKKYWPQFRWLVERTIGWLSWNRSLKTCWCKTIVSFIALFRMAASIQLFKMSGVK